MANPILSVVIPTYNSGKILEVCLQGLIQQTAPKDTFEIIIADNNSSDKTTQLAKKYGAKVVNQEGKPPQVCGQRNLGIASAAGDYILVLDHDMELSGNLVQNFLKLVSSNSNQIEAWYIPEKIIASSALLGLMRNFENEFYKNSPISAARLIKKRKIKETKGFDVALSSGPADWDMDIQLHLQHTKFDNLKDVIYHHEEGLSFWQYITKKGRYVKGGEIYKQKWQKTNTLVYNEIVAKQYSPVYRLIGVFIEKGKWKKLLPKLHLYFLFLFVKITMSALYYYRLKRLK